MELEMESSAKPDYVTALETVYGVPSQEGFGSSVFFAAGSRDLEEISKHFYQQFVGKRWDEIGAEVWLASWKETYRRPSGGDRNIETELRGVNDPAMRPQVGMILDSVENAAAGRVALSQAFDSPDVEDLRAFVIGDGEAMTGLLLAGQRQNGDATLVVFLMD